MQLATQNSVQPPFWAIEPEPARSEVMPDAGCGRARPPELKLKRILVPVDFSECSRRALKFAGALASRLKAKITLLHVVKTNCDRHASLPGVKASGQRRHDGKSRAPGSVPGLERAGKGRVLSRKMNEPQTTTREDPIPGVPLTACPDALPLMRSVHPKQKLSQRLLELAGRFQDRPVRLLDVLQTTQGRGYDLLLLILVLPFLTPIPLPFLSTPFGLAVALIGLRMAVGRKPWLPEKLLLKELPPRFFQKLLRASGRGLRFLEWFLKPRLGFMRETLVFQRVTGALVAASGLLLLLPLPIPFSNFLPAFTILLLAAGAMARDGWCLIGGWVMFAVTAGFFTLLAFGGTQALGKILGLFT